MEITIFTVFFERRRNVRNSNPYFMICGRYALKKEVELWRQEC